MGLFPEWTRGGTPSAKDVVEAARKRLKEDPADAAAVLRLADALAGSGQKIEAVGVLNRHGPIIQARGRLEEAIAVYKKAVQLDPGFRLSSSTFLSQLELEKILEAEKKVREAAPPGPVPPPSGTFTSPGPEPPPPSGAFPLPPAAEAPPSSGSFTLPAPHAGPPSSGSFPRPETPAGPPPSGAFARPIPAAGPPPRGSFPLPEPPPEPSEWSRKKDAVHGARFGIPILRDVPPLLFDLVLQRIRLRSLAPGEVLFREGSEGSSVYFVVQGTLGLTALNDAGTEVLVRTARDGEAIGEASFLTGLPHYATVTAWEQSNLLELDHQALDPIARKHRPLADALNRLYEERVLGAALARSRVFGVLNETERRQLARRMGTVAVKAGTPVVRQGQPSKGTFVVKRGAFRVTFRSGEREVAVALLRPHEVFGDLGEGTRAPQAESVTAVTESELLCLPADEFAALRSRSPQLSAALDALRFDRAERCVAALRAARP